MVSDELRKRVITGVGLAATFVVLDILANYFEPIQVLVAGIAAAAVLICSIEVGRIIAFHSGPARLGIAVAFCAPVLGVFLLFSLPSTNLSAEQRVAAGFCAGVATGTLVAGLVSLVDARNELLSSVNRIVSTAVGFLLVGLGGAAFVAVTLHQRGGALVGWLVAVVCFCDTAAYFTGRSIGGPKLAPAISPGKTVSGSLGGIIASAVVGAALYRLLSAEGSWMLAALLAVVVAVCSQVGDLLKSLIKRIWGVKDSGSILPGHGGVLDRVDGLLGGALVVWAAVVVGLL